MLSVEGGGMENGMRDRENEIDRVIADGFYHPDWDSLTQMQSPSWFSDAKFGIFIHWGLYSVPAFRNEWYSRNMYIQDKEEWQHHRDTYGEHQTFGYKDFIPLFDAKKFDADEWAQIIADCGARYVFPVAEHHDGFQMYRSELSHFNAYEMGPKRDILGELKQAFERKNLVFCTSSHRAEHWFFMSHGKEFPSDIHEPLQCGDFYWPAMPEPENHHNLFSQPYPSDEFLQDWLLRTCELVDKYQPKLIYFDWWVEHEAFKPYLKRFAAYYYNRGLEWGEPVAICYKFDAMMFGSGIVEMERGAFESVKPYVWQTDTAIAQNSWCYTDSLDYKTAGEIICQLIDVVSKNGNLLLNIGPRADGSIPEKDKEILGEIGAWLRVNGEGIYGSRVWRKSSEGPTVIAEGQYSDLQKTVYTSEDYRFTRKGKYVYAYCMRYPENGEMHIRSFAMIDDQGIPEFHGIVEDVKVLGQMQQPVWMVDEVGIHIQAEAKKCELPVCVRLKIK